MTTKLLPWVLLSLAIVVALTVSSRPPTPKAADVPPSPASLPVPPPSSRFHDPPPDEKEQRDSRIHIPHEECEEGVKRINELEGLAPTDPKGLHFVGLCLRHGNVAWYKCILQAPTRLDAATCNRRFLTNDPGL